MPLTNTNRRRLRITAICLGITLFIVVVASIFIDRYFQPIIKDQIRKTVHDATDNLYHISFSSLRFNVLNGNIQIKNIELTPDTAVYARMKKQKLAPNNLYSLNVDRIELKGLRSMRLYLHREVKLSAIIVRNPSLKIVYEPNREENDTASGRRSVYDRIKSIARSVAVGRIQMSGIDFKYVNLARKKTSISSIKDLAINARDVLIDSLSEQRKGRFLFCKDISVELRDYNASTPNKLYNYGFELLQFSTSQHFILVKGLEFFSSKVKPAEKPLLQNNGYKVRFDTVMLRGIDFHTLNNYQKLRASALRISEGYVNVFAKKKLHNPKEINRARNYPHIALKRLDFDVHIDTVQLNNIDITYTEKSNENMQSGILTFKNLGGHIFNVTNSARYLQKNHIAKAALFSYLMGTGRLDVNMAFDLTDQKGGFTYQGTLGYMILRPLNQITKPLGLIEIRSGAITRLDFNMKGDTSGSSGTVTARYNNLSIKLLRKREESDRLIRRGLVSLFANALVIKSDNPTSGGPVREIFVHYARPAGSSFFKLMWRTVFLGLKEAMGITPDKEREINRRVDHLNDLKNRLELNPENKIKRQERKAERKRKRAERKAQKDTKKVE